MSTAARRNEFLDKLQELYRRFRNEEAHVRKELEEADEDLGLLERRTRRYIIDPLLVALDWSPDDPDLIREEARSRGADDSRLFFDYLGLHRDGTSPVMFVEAKGFDVSLPEGSTAYSIANTLDKVKIKQSANLDSFEKLLRGSCDYAQSLEKENATPLKRAIITSGKWILIFIDPLSAFSKRKKADPETIIYLQGYDQVISAGETLFNCLHRSALVDTLPFELDVTSAVRVLQRKNVKAAFNGVLVSSSPVEVRSLLSRIDRCLFPTIIIQTHSRLHALFDPHLSVREDMQTPAATVNKTLSQLGAQLEKTLSPYFDITEKKTLDFISFTDFSDDNHAVVRGSTLSTGNQDNYCKRLGAPFEGSTYVIATGPSWHYKRAAKIGSACSYHTFQAGESRTLISEATTRSMTKDKQHHHCAHDKHKASREIDCIVASVEENLCCRACVFEDICWGETSKWRPCPL